MKVFVVREVGKVLNNIVGCFEKESEAMDWAVECVGKCPLLWVKYEVIKVTVGEKRRCEVLESYSRATVEESKMKGKEGEK